MPHDNRERPPSQSSTPDNADSTTSKYDARELEDSPYALDHTSPFTTTHASSDAGAGVPNMNPPPDLSPFQSWTIRATDSQFHATAGAIGGIASGIVTCPLDVIKTKLQAQGGFTPISKGRGHVGHPQLYNGLVGTATTIWKSEGLRGMYRGLGPIVMGYLPTWAVWFTVYNKAKAALSPHYSMFAA